MKCPPETALSKRLRTYPFAVFTAASLGSLALATALDRPLWTAGQQLDKAVLYADWFLALRSLGYLPVWLVVALAFFLHDRGRARSLWDMASRGVFMSVSVLAAGGTAEALKLVIRRLRPNLSGGEYLFRPFADQPFATVDLGMPSGHAIVAFAAAWVLCRLYPRTAAVWFTAACACAATRVVSGAHFVSDTVAAALLAYVVARVVWSGTSRVGDLIGRARRVGMDTAR